MLVYHKHIKTITKEKYDKTSWKILWLAIISLLGHVCESSGRGLAAHAQHTLTFTSFGS